MKKILLTLILFASVGLTAKLQAQSCTLSNFSVHLNSSTTVGGNCQLNVDFSFDLAHNNGFKHMWIHLWTQAGYPNPPLSYTHIPTPAELANTVGNIGLDITVSGGVTSATLQSSYPGGSGVLITGGSVSVSNGGGAGGTDRFTITGVMLVVPGSCSSSAVIKGDDWGTNSSSQNSVQCVNQGFIFLANDPTITGFETCTSPRTLNIGISTYSTTPITVAYKLYKDNGNGIFEPGVDALVADSTGPYTIVSGSPYSKSGVGYTGNNTPGFHNIWVAVTNSVTSNVQVVLLSDQGCAPLPVNFVSFTAQRIQSNVKLVWQTATEINNSGFEVERNINGTWEQVAFIPSQANGGNSADLLTYSYIDANNAKGITQYRIRQIDLDNKSAYSQIVAVRGTDSPAKTIIYPNPSFDGRVNVVFEDANNGLRDISLMDMSGRIIKQWNGVSNNNLTIDNLTPGFYSLRVVVRETGAQSVEKIVINKR